METVLIKCADTGATLKFFNPEWTAKDAPEYFDAMLEANGLQATVRVYSLMSLDIVTFFERMANDWKGWEGKREWRSLEAQLELLAKSDSLGHVTLDVQLRQDGFQWRVECSLMLEAGQLDAIADQVHRFWTYPGK